MATVRTEIWTYRDRNWTTGSLIGYSVEALDGGIGKIDDASYDVDTGPWIFGKKVMLPAGVVVRVNHDDETVFVNRTKEQIKNAPELDEDQYRDDSYRGGLGSYYDRGGAGWNDV